ncbi:MAG TPA: hypothetical protein VJ440_04075 [Candidatus Brocadiaceae bacterium]|nr:hypothetical protein [Candidatus Brocadiaceae bacterium]
MKKQKINPENMFVLYDELEQECLNAVKYIEALKVSRLSSSQKEDILGELSASITHLRIQTELLDKQFDDI